MLTTITVSHASQILKKWPDPYAASVACGSTRLWSRWCPPAQMHLPYLQISFSHHATSFLHSIVAVKGGYETFRWDHTRTHARTHTHRVRWSSDHSVYKYREMKACDQAMPPWLAVPYSTEWYHDVHVCFCTMSMSVSMSPEDAKIAQSHGASLLRWVCWITCIKLLTLKIESY